MSEMNNEKLEQMAKSALDKAAAAQAETPAKDAQYTEIPKPFEPVKESAGLDVRPDVTDRRDNDEFIPAPPTTAEMAATAVTSDDAVIISGSNVVTPADEEEDETVILTNIAKDNMKDMPETEVSSYIEGIMPEIANYKKQLIIEMGMTPAEAAAAAQNRMRGKAAEANKKYAEDHPDGVIVTIDKSQEKDLKFTEEEKHKLQVSKALKLVVVESQDLETLKVKPSKGKISMTQIRDICGSLSHYSVPLLDFGDYATFTGAQTGALANAVSNEDDDFIDTIEKKASLLYKYFDKGTVASRFAENGTTPKTYEEFCNWFKYDDIDMGIYAIVTASAMEETESSYVCQNPQCRKMYNVKYSNKTLLDLSDLPESFKTRVTEIDAARSSIEKMQAIHDKCCVNVRLKSPKSENIYEMGSPTIADVRNRLDKCMDQINEANALDMILLLYVDKFWVYDRIDDEYIEVNVRENPTDAFEILTRLHQVDLDLLTNWINENHYRPSFKIKTKCPHCGREETDVLSVDGMIFLHARASSVVIA